MKRTPIREGELLAYLDGEGLPHVEQELQASPGLRREIDAFLRRAFADLDRPDPQDLVDVVAGQATAAQRLLVAAWTRSKGTAQREIEALRNEWDTMQRTEQKRRPRRPRFLAVPLGAAVGVRTLAESAEQSFYAAELQAQVTLRVAPVSGEQWRIEGYVTQSHQPAANARVTLRSERARPRPRHTDEAGIFVFPKLAAGVYQLRVAFEQGILYIPELVLDDG